MSRTKKAVTIQDVAEAAGVSISTVSRVLNDKDDVAPETYQKVRDIIEELGYTSSLAARSMRSRKTNVIGLSFGLGFSGFFSFLSFPFGFFLSFFGFSSRLLFGRPLSLFSSSGLGFSSSLSFLSFPFCLFFG